MKKLQLVAFICCLCTTLSAQQRTDEKFNVSSLFGFPITTGDLAFEKQDYFVSNLLYPVNIELNKLPKYQVGSIPTQTVWHNGNGCAFYILTDTLGNGKKNLSFTVNSSIQGTIDFNPENGYFKYTPDISDIWDFTVTFTGSSDMETIAQPVIFTQIPDIKPEYSVIADNVEKPLPQSTDEYTIITQSTQEKKLNYQQRTAYSYSISGKELIFDDQLSNKLSFLNEREDIYELNLYAETLIIRSALKFYGTHISIHARKLIFEDRADQERSCICTSPIKINELTNGNGFHAEDAGNITLHISQFISDPAIRFILIGGQGQNTNNNGVPGNGGNAGHLSANFDLASYSDLTGGSGGNAFGLDIQHIVRSASKGKNGTAEYIPSEYEWLHPYFLTSVVKNANDAFLHSNTEYTYQIFNDYLEILADYEASQEWVSLSDELRSDLQKNKMEMQAACYKINNNLDFFGNSPGWVPMLSFEVNKLAFEQEVDKAIKVLYLSYWLKNIDNQNQMKSAAYKEGIKNAKKELGDNRETLNKLITSIPVLEDEIRQLAKSIDLLNMQAESLKNQLLFQARKNVKKRNKALKNSGIYKALLKIVPTTIGTLFGTPQLGTAAGNIISQIANISDADGYGESIINFYDKASLFLKDTDFENLQKTLNKIDISNLDESAKIAYDTYKQISTSVEPLMKSIKELNRVFSQNSAPQNEIEKELEALLSQSREFQSLIGEAKILTDKKMDFQKKIAETLSGIQSVNSEISNNLIAIGKLNVDQFNLNSKQDLGAMQYLDDMERRAKYRLLKYHYYMAKAYEYRLLEPYKGELDLSSIFERFKNIAQSNPDNPSLSENDFNNLKAVFEEQISSVTEYILNQYNNGQRESSEYGCYTLMENELKALNTGGSVHINLYERGFFNPYYENIRIVNIKLNKITCNTIDHPVNFASTSLKFRHSGISKLNKNGNIYQFSHINGENDNPVVWSIKYDVLNNKIVTQEEPSFASGSLLYAILKNLNKDKDIMVYSRPGAYADITLTKINSVSDNTPIYIKELSFDVEYDYSNRSDNLASLNISANGLSPDSVYFDLQPYISASYKDINKRGSGRGFMQRLYNKGSYIKFKAPVSYGEWKFNKWTYANGDSITGKPEIEFRLNDHQSIVAKYVLNLPKLSLPDTISVEKEGGSILIPIINSNQEAVEDLDWISDCPNTWFRINEGNEGTNDGIISLEIEKNNTTEKRIAPLTISSYDTWIPSVTSYIVQKGNSSNPDSIETVVNDKESIKIFRYSKNEYTIELPKKYNQTSIEVYDVTGKLVMQKNKYGQLIFNINIAHCMEGTYILKLICDNQSFIYKITR